MQLVTDICVGLSTKNADKILKQYRRLARIAGEAYCPKVTASYSIEPKSSGGGVNKATEMMVVRRVDAQMELEAMAEAINSLSDLEYCRILIERYCRK
ncbi:ArpU family phage packaging/lysis transcriptional regulator, partial [Streptococcus sp. DD10]|uniref:ArpU family phage packaging/lysis transcriptional regulator n=1 Tax=Streptococcus sp. DD10 TaxID=1777878 RepID=UPI000A983777